MPSLIFIFAAIVAWQFEKTYGSDNTQILRRVRRKTLTIPHFLDIDTTSFKINKKLTAGGEFGSDTRQASKIQDDIVGKHDYNKQFEQPRGRKIATISNFGSDVDIFERLLEFGGSLSISMSLSMPTTPTTPTATSNPVSSPVEAPSTQTKNPKETKEPKATKVPKGTLPPKETKAPKGTIPPKESKAPKGTIPPKESKAPKETIAPKGTKNPKDKNGNDLPTKSPSTLVVPPTPTAPVQGTCSSNPACAALNLEGDCCPTLGGVFLDCCQSKPSVPSPVQTLPTAPFAPVNAPSTGNQTPNSVTVPTIANPVSAPSVPSLPTAGIPTAQGTCDANPACAALNLAGDCCPTPAGVFLDCCIGAPVGAEGSSSTNAPSGVGFLNTPTLSDTVSSDVPTFDGAQILSDIPSTVRRSIAPSGETFVTQSIDRKNLIPKKCGITEIERSDLLISMIRNVSGTEALTNSDSPQFRALYWIDQVDESILCPSDPKALVQRYSVAVNYFALNGSGWNKSARWLGSSSECDWFGVSCDSSSNVTGIVLKHNNLTGFLPPELFKLTSLTGLSLDHNKISGTIPDQIGLLHVLEELELDDNSFVGSIPSAIYEMSTLKALDLNTNNLTGTLGDEIGNLVDLLVLQVENNNLGGDIPWYGLAMSDKLLVLYLQGNNFTTGNSLEPVCAQVKTRRIDYPGFLQFFAADCSVKCSCCTECF